MKPKIIFFTATRAEYGLLRWIIKKLQKEFQTYVIVGGSHLSHIDNKPTINEIKNDNIKNLIKLPYLAISNTKLALTSSIGNGIIQISQIFNLIKPNIIILLGDRYELFIPAIAGIMYKIIIIHLNGGERTEGLIDEQIRHSITKLSHIHMPSTQFYAENISKMGEEDWRIHIVGSSGLENIKKLKLFNKEEILKITGVNVNKPTIICTYHPVTLENLKALNYQINNLLQALQKFNLQIVFTKPNAEIGSDIIINKINKFIKENKNAYYFNSLGSKLYLSFLKYSKAIIGNSSSGIIEAPSFKIPVINIGNRQKGRYKTKNIIQTGYNKNDIIQSLNKALYNKSYLDSLKNLKNPYGDGNTSEYVLQAIYKIIKLDKEKLLKKNLTYEVKSYEWNKYF